MGAEGIGAAVAFDRLLGASLGFGTEAQPASVSRLLNPMMARRCIHALVLPPGVFHLEKEGLGWDGQFRRSIRALDHQAHFPSRILKGDRRVEEFERARGRGVFAKEVIDELATKLGVNSRFEVLRKRASTEVLRLPLRGQKIRFKFILPRLLSTPFLIFDGEYVSAVAHPRKGRILKAENQRIRLGHSGGAGECQDQG